MPKLSELIGTERQHAKPAFGFQGCDCKECTEARIKYTEAQRAVDEKVRELEDQLNNSSSTHY